MTELTGPSRPVARIWSGKVRRGDADAYAALMRSTAVPDYRATAGNVGAWVLRRDDDAVTEIAMLTMWDSLEAVRRFAGEAVDQARYYDFDATYLLERPERVDHFTIDSDVAPASTSAAADPERLIGAACTLGAAELRERLGQWSALRERAVATDQLPGGLRLILAASESLDDVATLVAQESACCEFYRFTLRVDGPARVLEIDAGAGNAGAVQALLGLA